MSEKFGGFRENAYFCSDKRNNGKEMRTEHLDFVTFCVGSLADALHQSASQTYNALRSTGILNDYIIPCYDVLHTFSKEYIIDDLTEMLRERGALA